MDYIQYGTKMDIRVLKETTRMENLMDYIPYGTKMDRRSGN